MSFLAWIDFDQADRERTHRIIDLFKEPDARDELGIGAVRDGLSDLLFPGTSTIQTRLRYMLFVPWIYLRARGVAGSPAARLEAARQDEVALVGALERGGERSGVIGAQAREALQRPPSEVYWSGLARLGIRRFQGTRTACLEARSDGPVPDSRFWSPGLPPEDKGFLAETTFRLRREEADFLVDRLADAAPGSLFRELAQGGAPAKIDDVWAHPGRPGWSADNRSLVDHAERFSLLMHGAALLYNLMLSERVAASAATEVDDRRDRYARRLADWSGDVASTPLRDWDLEDLFARCEAAGYRVTPRTRRFVEEWRSVVRTSGAADDPAARRAVETRERQLKGAKSRFGNPAALARWGGASGTERLSFRWPIVRDHLTDLADAR